MVCSGQFMSIWLISNHYFHIIFNQHLTEFDRKSFVSSSFAWGHQFFDALALFYCYIIFQFNISSFFKKTFQCKSTSVHRNIAQCHHLEAWFHSIINVNAPIVILWFNIIIFFFYTQYNKSQTTLFRRDEINE